jgi:hypothetical protein
LQERSEKLSRKSLAEAKRPNQSKRIMAHVNTGYFETKTFPLVTVPSKLRSQQKKIYGLLKILTRKISSEHMVEMKRF